MTNGSPPPAALTAATAAIANAVLGFLKSPARETGLVREASTVQYSSHSTEQCRTVPNRADTLLFPAVKTGTVP